VAFPPIPTEQAELTLSFQRIWRVLRDVQVYGHRVQVQNLFAAEVAAGWHTGMHWHPFYEAHLVIRGAAVYPRAQAEEYLTPGAVVLHAPRIRHTWQAGDEALQRIVCWFTADPPLSLTIPPVWPHHPEALGELAIMLTEARTMRPGWDDRVHAQLTSLFSRILMPAGVAYDPNDLAKTERDDRWLVSTIDGILHRHLAEPTTLHTIAREVGISVRTLTRRIRQATGQTVGARLTTLRMEHAAALLAYTDLPLYAIAAQVGFSTPSYFARGFRQQFGLTPRDFRRRAISASAPERQGALIDRA
jgi:AraC-like DNA-binding protein/quercetin dioxygenase-like cupin family protein